MPISPEAKTSINKRIQYWLPLSKNNLIWAWQRAVREYIGTTIEIQGENYLIKVDGATIAEVKASTIARKRWEGYIFCPKDRTPNSEWHRDKMRDWLGDYVKRNAIRIIEINSIAELKKGIFKEMNEEMYENIKKSNASWAIWGKSDDPNSDDFYEGYPSTNFQDEAKKLKPYIVMVGLNEAVDGYVEEKNKQGKPFSNFHIYPGETIGGTKNLIYAFKGTKFEGAYMTDIVKLKTLKNSGFNGKLTDSKAIMDHIKEHPEVKQENIDLFKEELEKIGVKNPLIVAMGKGTTMPYELLKQEERCIGITFYSNFHGDKEKYKETVEKEIREQISEELANELLEGFYSE